MIHERRSRKQLITTHYLYRTYSLMKNRCNNPRAHNYKYYGGRGIYVCDRWLNSFWDFVADVGQRPLDHQLDRIDNDGPYHPDNIRWSTRSQQQRNTQRTRWVTSESGETKPMIAWAEIAESIGIKQETFRQRIYAGKTVEQALTHKKLSKQAA